MSKPFDGEALSKIISEIVHKERDQSERYLSDLQRRCATTRNELLQLDREVATLREVLQSDAYADLIRRAKAEQ